MRSNTGGEDPNKGIVTASGPLWKEQRTVSLYILRAFGMGKNILALKISEEVSAYLNKLTELRGEPSEVHTLTRTAVANIICSIIVGKRFEYDDDYFIQFVWRLAEVFRLSQRTSMFTVFPWLRYLPGDLFKAKERMAHFRNIIDHFCLHYIEKTRNEDPELNSENFISAYLHEKEKREKQGQDTTLDDENLSRVLFNLFLAGTDTISTSIAWFMVHILHHPEVQEKMFAEISDVVGTERAPTMHDKNKLNYTMAAITEALRLAGPPFG
ncbi:cytochrome P450 II f2-like protein II [Elysia marginata]|uniref:Cytochrome P450 II f2-like protein II n=1 Tax=Elysia marginata TaxID=1093978 RepID=A0AAV4HWJ6_9GAST|nr:cytochrome P450 II f2-like protein II [Elysia marginata]